MARRGKGLNDDDRALLALAMADVTPMPGRIALQVARVIEEPVKTQIGPPPQAARPVPGQPQARQLDRRTRQRLERGQMEIDATLDLHGCGQIVAREQLHSFLRAAWSRHARCVLVITGKGRQGEGILRNRLPEWVMEAPTRDIVLEVTPARPPHGGGGAYYVLLRRQRHPS